MENKKRQIIEKAKILFNNYGLRSVTMDEIANELSISKKTLYTFFKDKKSLIEKILEEEVEKMDKKFLEVSEKSENAIDVLLKINNEMLKFISKQPTNVNYDLKKYYPELWKKIRDTQNKKMFTAIVKNLQRGIKEGLIRKDIIPEIIAKIQIQRSVSLFDGTYDDILDKFSKEEISKETLKYHIYGICTPKGIKFFNDKTNQK